MAEIDDTQLLSLNDFQQVSHFTEDKNIMVWENGDEDPSKISGANFISSMRQLFIEGVNAFQEVDYFSQSAPIVVDPSGGETWISYDGKFYVYNMPTSQWIFESLADENTVYIADAALPIGMKRRYSVIFRNGTYILLSMVDLANSINDTSPISTTTTFSSKKLTELLADEKDPVFNAWLIDNAAYLQILLDDAPTNPSTKFLNGLRQWVDVAVVGGGGYQAPLYITNLPSFVAGYKQIAYERQEIGFQTDITLRNETVLVNTFLFEGQIDTTTIDSGNYIFASRAKIDSAGGNTHFRIAPFLRHANGSETVLFTFECDEITYTSYQDVQKSFPYGTITCVETDRFGFRLYLVTASTSNKTVNLLGGDGYPTFLVTPARLRHNQLRDLNGDEAHLHITQSEKDDFVTASDFVEDFISNATDILYADLLALINNDELVPSSNYRITNYTTTTVQVDTTSAGHDFDIIVTALSTNKLSENAKCVRKAGDTYFENAKLEAWEIKYCIHNDTSRFAWADTVNGKGVIYYMKDERDNECNYDFKNIQFLKDLNYYYTFDLCTDSIEHRDHSIVSQHVLCTGNKISMIDADGDDVYSKMLYLNIFKNTSITSNCTKNEVLGYNNVFGSDVGMNKFGDLFYDNTIGNGAIFNTFTGYNNGNIMGDNLTSNTIHMMVDCSIGNNAANNITNMCMNVTLNNNCQGNTFSGYSVHIILPEDSIMNNFGEYVANLTFSHSIVSCIIKNGTQNCNFTLNPSIGADRILYTVFNVPPVNGETINVEIEKTPLDSGEIYTWVVDKNMSDEIVQYCLGDIIDKLAKNVANVTNVTYNELVNLRGSSDLIPDMDYRITDYNTTTNQTDTQSAGHDFDIIVTALSTNKLSENAKCVRKAGDTYFENAKLEAWEIKYCIDNDTTRFAWADSTSGKGVIYYMKDEWNNECPYDFKNIQFLNNGVSYYTFSAFENTTEEINDSSLMKYRAADDDLNGMTNNKIKPAYTYLEAVDNWLTPQKLNNIIFKTYYDEENYAIYLPWGNSFGVGCYDIFFNGTEFTKSNTFGNDCSSNTFGDNCYSNTFGDNCVSNTFGNGFNSNTFGDNCYSNTFGDSCGSNTFGSECSNNTFGNACNSNTFGNYCHYNTFGNSCGSNTFGDGCRFNNFYIGTSGTTKKDFIRYIVLEDGCTYNNFYSTLTTSGTSFLQRIRIKGLGNTTPTNIQITLSEVNTKYEWVICYTSGNVLKQYCPDD